MIFIKYNLAYYLYISVPAKPCDSNADDDDADYRRHSNDRHQNYH